MSPAAVPVESNRKGNLLYRYIFWTYERGSLHYDVMVTLILLFLFIAPHVIDFHDRPLPEIPARASEVLVRDAGTDGARHKFVYEVRAEDVRDIRDPAELQARIHAKVLAIAPDAEVTDIQPLKDPRGQTVAYDATVLR